MTKKRYYHRKLIRDKIPEFIEKNKGEYEAKVLTEAEFEKELRKKLVEESKELIDAPKESLLNELADVLELVKSIASHYKLSFPQVEEYQKQKRKKRGRFKKRLFLIWSTGKSGK